MKHVLIWWHYYGASPFIKFVWLPYSNATTTPFIYATLKQQITIRHPKSFHSEERIKCSIHGTTFDKISKYNFYFLCKQV